MTGGLNRIGHYNAHRLINTLHIQLPFDNKSQVLVVLLSCGMDRMAWNTVDKNHTSKNWHATLCTRLIRSQYWAADRKNEGANIQKHHIK